MQALQIYACSRDIHLKLVGIFTTGVTCTFNQELVAGYVILATGMMEFE